MLSKLSCMAMALVLCTALLPGTIADEPTKQLSADQALQKLKDGNARFAADNLAKPEIGMARRAELAKGQHPFAIVLTCADSRVAPELLFNQGLGDLFVLRVAGNVTDALMIGSIEYAVEFLKVPLIVVLGHDDCGAVAGAMTTARFPVNLQKLLQTVHVGEDLPMERAKALPLAIKNNIQFHADQMVRRSEVLKKAVENRKLRIVGGMYQLSSGRIDWLNAKD